ncbi:hypothetical protein TMatcc_009205 [Talaromyces marneffei ATCC 18224]
MNIDSTDSTGSITLEASNKPLTKRHRIQLSCAHCRHAKLKCDREKPCSQCVKRGRSSQCTFPSLVARKRPVASMQNRLKHLESLVKGAMASQPPDEHQPIHAGATSHPPLPDNYAGMDISGRLVGLNDTTYIGGSHWAAILEDIEEMKGYFSEDIEETSLGVGSTRPDISLLLNNTESPTTYKDLLAALPGRSMVNRLVSRYFNSNSPALRKFHLVIFKEIG